MSALATNCPPPTLATLLKRLKDYGVRVHRIPTSDEPDAAEVADAVTRHSLHLVQCAGAVIDGRWQPAVTFERYYRELFGRDLDGKPARSQVGLRVPKGRRA